MRIILIVGGNRELAMNQDVLQMMKNKLLQQQRKKEEEKLEQ